MTRIFKWNGGNNFDLLPPRQVRCQNEGLRRQPPPRSPARPHSNALSPGKHNCSIFLKGFIFTFSELLWLEDGNSRPESTLSTNNNGSPLPSPSTILLASQSLWHQDWAIVYWWMGVNNLADVHHRQLNLNFASFIFHSTVLKLVLGLWIGNSFSIVA